ncbi:MAG: hypothetical protein BJ554DRAFT_998 [Olpidium bornovanus]|uniref:Uncharacterized protein n=1 Tax=Olpidium bornovanus TaxID=278681 RepID=A0A8H7ZSJ8_9FUNG|nr:MAG: hypothetical protein BJ554DRAFT_998 [Olpidium bornovanus]
MGNTKWTRWFAKTALMQAVSLGLLEGVVLYLHYVDAQEIGDAVDENIDSTFRSLLVYHILFILAQFFQLVLVFDALREQNILQIIAVFGFNLLILAYSVVQTTQTRNLYEVNETKFPTLQKYLVYTVEYVVIGLSLIFTTVLSVMSFNLYREFGWSIYKTIGADLRMRDIYKNYLALVLLLKLDVFFFVGFSFQFVVLVRFGPPPLFFRVSLLRDLNVSPFSAPLPPPTPSPLPQGH